MSCYRRVSFTKRPLYAVVSYVFQPGKLHPPSSLFYCLFCISTRKTSPAVQFVLLFVLYFNQENFTHRPVCSIVCSVFQPGKLHPPSSLFYCLFCISTRKTLPTVQFVLLFILYFNQENFTHRPVCSIVYSVFQPGKLYPPSSLFYCLFCISTRKTSPTVQFVLLFVLYSTRKTSPIAQFVLLFVLYFNQENFTHRPVCSIVCSVFQPGNFFLILNDERTMVKAHTKTHDHYCM